MHNLPLAVQQTDAVLGHAQLFRDRLLQLVHALARVHRNREAAACRRADVQRDLVARRQCGYVVRLLVVVVGVGGVGGRPVVVVAGATAATVVVVQDIAKGSPALTLCPLGALWLHSLSRNSNYSSGMVIGA